MNLSGVLLVAFVGALGVAEFQVLPAGALPTALMAAILLCAVMFGAVFGGFALALGAVALQAHFGGPWPADDRGVLLVFASAVLGSGGYTDLVRRQSRQTLTLRQAAAPLTEHGSGYEVQELLRDRLTDSATSMSPREEAQRGLVSLSVVGSGAVIGYLARDILGAPMSLGAAIASVLIVGGLVGARYGLFGGILAWLALDRLVLGSNSMVEAAVGMSAFAAMGWGAGLLGDRTQQARRALETLVAAGRDLSAINNETDIRRALMDSLGGLSPRSRVQICDTDGQAFVRSPGAGGDWTASDPRWRTRELSAAGRQVGLVRWWFPGSRRDVQSLDEIAVSLIDLAASAIVRSKLNVEKGDIETIARTEHLRSILLDAVAHHFRSPLAGILGSVTSILSQSDEKDPATQRELLFIIKEQANRLSRYVDNFLSVARLESGDVEVTMSEVNVESLVYDVWEKFGEAGGARRFLAADVDLPSVMTDAGLLSQALGNVLENAIKYSPEGSTVAVHARRESEQLIIEVRDEGSGVPPERQARIFERFYRSAGERAPGLGLGLYITRSLIETLGGTIVAQSPPDGGAGLLMTLTLPCAEVPA